jgi:hypothetical protein
MAMRIKNNTTATQVALPRNDINLSNMYQQGIWPLLESRCTHPLLQDPALGACIHIDPLNSVSPDCDLHPTGQYELFQSRSTSIDLPDNVNVHLPSGKLAGRLSRSRVTALHTAFRKCAESHWAPKPDQRQLQMRNCQSTSSLQTWQKSGGASYPQTSAPLDHTYPSHDSPPTKPGTDQYS